MWRKDVKVAPCTSQNHLSIKQKAGTTMYKRAGGYLQGIRRIKLSLRGLHIIASIDCGVYKIHG